MTDRQSDSNIGAQSLLWSLLIFTALFYLARPPALLFWAYGPGADQVVVPQDRESSANDLSLPAPLSIMQPPLVPASISDPNLPQRWTDDLPDTPDMDALAFRLFRLSNAEREVHDLPPLQPDAVLSEIATRHSRDMLERNYLGHISPDNDGPAQRVGTLHRSLFGTVGENVARIESQAATSIDNAAEEFMEIWLNSLPHARNILSRSYTHSGVGCYESSDGDSDSVLSRLCTQLFAQVIAYADGPIPFAANAGDTLVLAIARTDGSPLEDGSQISQVSLQSLDVRSTYPLSVSERSAAGSLELSGPSGTYALRLEVPEMPGSGTREAFLGPYVNVSDD